LTILGIESSCDDTAAAVVTDGVVVRASIVASQIADHAVFGGVVPEVASRKHIECICAVVEEALHRADISFTAIDAIAATCAPGLIGALLIGLNYAKGLAYALGKPLIAVHHMRGHIAANYIGKNPPVPPFLALTVSGGHTQLVCVEDYTKFRILGTTRDDAAGECLDKVARVMGLPYPGGVHLDALAQGGVSGKYVFPMPRVSGNPLDFSFSGLKTAGLLAYKTAVNASDFCAADFARAFQEKAAAYLCKNTLLAARQTGLNRVALAGGVSANTALRTQMARLCEENGLQLFLPQLQYCGDNAAMIAVQGFYELQAGHIADKSCVASPSLPIDYAV
jgi:N6-L-threonylcarbamoyladenine synthase